MSKRKIQDSITGSIKQPIARMILFVPVFFGVFVSSAIFMPSFAKETVLVASFLGITGITTSFWLNFKPDLVVKFLNFTSMTSLWVIIAIRAFGYVWPHVSVLMGILISTTVIVAHIIPIFNSSLAWFFRGELSSLTPKTFIGKFFLKTSLAVLPLAGFIGAAIGLFLNDKRGEIDIAVVVAGPLFWFLAIILPFSSAHPVSPWEPKRKLE